MTSPPCWKKIPNTPVIFCFVLSPYKINVYLETERNKISRCLVQTHRFGYQSTRRGLWPQAAFWVLCLLCNMQIVAFSEIYPQQAQQAGGIKVCQVDYVHLEANLGNN